MADIDKVIGLAKAKFEGAPIKVVRASLAGTLSLLIQILDKQNKEFVETYNLDEGEFMLNLQKVPDQVTEVLLADLLFGLIKTDASALIANFFELYTANDVEAFRQEGDAIIKQTLNRRLSMLERLFAPQA